MTYETGQSLSGPDHDNGADTSGSASAGRKKRTGSTVLETFGRPGGPGVRMPTVVLGLVLLVIAASVTISHLTDVDVDPGAIAIAVMIGAGVLLVAGARRRP